MLSKLLFTELVLLTLVIQTTLGSAVLLSSHSEFASGDMEDDEGCIYAA